MLAIILAISASLGSPAFQAGPGFRSLGSFGGFFVHEFVAS
jgi:hypothetical protein